MGYAKWAADRQGKRDWVGEWVPQALHTVTEHPHSPKPHQEALAWLGRRK